jgi:hypothetical protein
MRKDESTRRYTAEELKATRRRGEDRTDWAKVDAVTEAGLERAIAEDDDERDLEPDWTRAELVMPWPRQSVHLRLDPEGGRFLQSRRQGPPHPHASGPARLRRRSETPPWALRD